MAVFQLALYSVWLMFLGWKVSEMVRSGPAPVRAALCVAIGIAISWSPLLIRRLFDVDPSAAGPATLDYLFVQVGAPLVAFVSLWAWLGRRRADDKDLSKIFE
ncbi:hypothetical protein P1X14_02025 [Sphingomonas sp. AOB5]|uniref:hypothetical protein n=1 Tax=Sphingomonas sp. AOB5 TaxID=3034017 RepID=UPI0023F70A49|nr:hypothetical protein [Sphingomonas sp. AOB5]MDF7774011.1 hypothetical protein [Sphingomonas sp. AOB5]